MEDNKTNVLVEKWNKILTEDTKKLKPIDEDSMGGMAQLLENQEQWMAENTNVAANIGVFTPILVPTVRRIFPALVANQIVGVQPMNAPNGYAFAWRASYGGDNSTGFGQNIANVDRGLTENSRTGGDFKSQVIYVPSAAAVAADLAVGDTVRDTNLGSGNVHGTVKYFEDSEGFTKVVVQMAQTGDAIDFPFIVDNNVFFSTDNDQPYAVAAQFGNEVGYNLIMRKMAGPHATATGEVLEDDMKSMRIGMERVSVEAKTRKLKAEYTLEMAQDLKAMHNIDAEAELMNVLQYEIAAEIDRELLQAINDNATAVTIWNYGTPGAQQSTAWYADGQWEIEKFRTLYTRIVKEANKIALTTRRGPGNFIVASVNVVSALEGLNNFMYSQVPNDVGPVNGVTRVGTLDGRFAVYLDSFHVGADYVTVGYKGAGTMDSGVLYCPYIPILMQQVTHEKTFQPAIGVMTRSAICYNMFGTQNYYRKFTADFTNSQLA